MSVVALFARAHERNNLPVYLAIRDAVRSARADAGFAGPFRLDSPATAERIRMSCPDEITRRYLSPIYFFVCCIFDSCIWLTALSSVSSLGILPHILPIYPLNLRLVHPNL